MSDQRSATETGAAPTLGQHHREILGEIGYDDGEIDALVELGVVG